MSTTAHDQAVAPTGILFADVAHSAQIDRARPLILEPVLGKPALQRAIELLVRLGCQDIHILLGDDAAVIRQHLQSGDRWGCNVHYHYLSAFSEAQQFIRLLKIDMNQHYWVGTATAVPILEEAILTKSDPDNFVHPIESLEPTVSGWAAFAGHLLTACNDWGVLRADPSAQIPQHESPTVRYQGALRCSTMAQFHASTQALVSLLNDQTVVRRGCHIHPSAKLVAPVWIGEQVKIGKDCVIGPNTRIEAMSVIDEGTVVTQSSVGDLSYVGSALEVTGSTIMRGQMYRASLAMSLDVNDEALLTGLTESRQTAWWLLTLVFVLKVGCSPLYGLMRAGWLKPARGIWRTHFYKTFFPGLSDVTQKTQGLVGHCEPLDDPGFHERQSLWSDNLTQTGFPGLLNEALVLGVHPSADPDFWMASNLYAVTKRDSVTFNVKLATNYLAHLIRDCISPQQPQTSLPPLNTKVADETK
jgi:hypothetical protein